MFFFHRQRHCGCKCSHFWRRRQYQCTCILLAKSKTVHSALNTVRAVRIGSFLMTTMTVLHVHEPFIGIECSQSCQKIEVFWRRRRRRRRSCVYTNHQPIIEHCRRCQNWKFSDDDDSVACTFVHESSTQHWTLSELSESEVSCHRWHDVCTWTIHLTLDTPRAVRSCRTVSWRRQRCCMYMNHAFGLEHCQSCHFQMFPAADGSAVCIWTIQSTLNTVRAVKNWSFLTTTVLHVWIINPSLNIVRNVRIYVSWQWHEYCMYMMYPVIGVKI